MANPRQSSHDSPTPASSSSKTESSGIGTTTLFSSQQKVITTTTQHTIVSGSVFSPGTPSDTTSSLSSFTSTGQQMLSPESIDSVVLTMSPVDQRAGIVGKTSTFKVQNRKSMDLEHVKPFSGIATTNGKCPTTNFNEVNENGNARSGRPAPPTTLNVIPLRVPPAPPPRWTKADNYMDLTPIADENAMIVNDKHTPTTQLNELLSPNANSTVSLANSFIA